MTSLLASAALASTGMTARAGAPEGTSQADLNERMNLVQR
jgi:hypothetical protein